MKKNKLTKKTRKALCRIQNIIEVNIDLAQTDITYYRTKADIEQHNLQSVCTDTEERNCLIARDDYIERANKAILKMQRLSILRDIFVAFESDFTKTIDDC